MGLPSFLKTTNNKVIFDDDGEMIYYVPEKYFNTNSAKIIGESVEVMGLFNYDVIYKSGKRMGVKNFVYPTMIKCTPTKITKETNYKITSKSEPADYRLLHFSKGAEAICNTMLPESVINCELFLALLMSAKLPPTISYAETHNVIIDNAAINGIKYGINAQMFGIVVSELYRDSKDITKPYRLSGATSMTDYQQTSIKNIPKYTSPFASITSENADESIAYAITNKGGVEESPVEKIMMN